MKPTLVLHPRYDEDSQLIWQAAVKRGWPIIRTQGWEGMLKQNGPVAIYGGHEWGQRVADGIGVKLLSPPDDALLIEPEEDLGRETWKVLRSEVGGQQFPVFAKSLHGKSIASRVYHSPDDFPPYDGTDEWLILQEPVVWEDEYRAFVLDGKPRTACRYATLGQLDIGPATQAAIDYVTSLRAVHPAALVVDVGRIRGRGWAMVETNPAWCSGLYACDPDDALDVIAAATTEPERRVDG